MAASVVSFVVERLGDMLIQEVVSLKGVGEQFERLQKELVSIIGFLKTADANFCEDPDILIWIADVRDIAYDVDDLIDAFFLKVASEVERGSNNILKKYALMPRKLFILHKIGKGIETIFTKIEDISDRRNRYGITNMSEKGKGSLTTNETLLRRSYPHATDDDPIGLEDQTSTLMAELTKEEDRLRVVSIYGMGGLGKTTLAKKAYNHRDFISLFDCYAWTFISQELSTGVVLQEILRQVSSFTNTDMEKMKEVELAEKLYAILQGKRYLVVLDDIWSKESWDILKPAFPNGRNGSKIVLTTRNKEVAMHADPWSRHFEPRYLSDEEAWELICKKAFRKDVSTNLSMSIDLEKCGRDVAKKCGGLPLAIVILGGVLATKKTLNEWENVSKHIGLYMSKGQAGVFPVLSFSYNDLPYHLKPFFLYLGLFPEDFQIPVKKLVQMWIAESMIAQERDGDQETLEETGRRYLDELIQRCMVEIGKKDLSGRVKACHLHDTMGDFCIAKAKEESFFERIPKSITSIDSSSSSSSSHRVTAQTKLRRCAIYLGDNERYLFPQYLTLRLRTVIFIRAPRISYSASPEIVYQDFRLVKVLELQGIPLEFSLFNKVIGKLTNLRYLGLRNTHLQELPESIGNLVRLQTLDVRNRSYNFKMPNVIWKMNS